MLPLFTSLLVAMDGVGTFRIAALIGGALLLVLWIATVKNFTALFYEKKKIRATIFFGLPGLILLVIGIFLVMTVKPMKANIYVSNSSEKEGKVEIEGETYALAPNTWQLIEIRTKEDSYGIKGWLGDSVVMDTVMGTGSYVGNLGGNKTVIAEEVEYSAFSFGSGSDDLVYEMVFGGQIARFSDEIVSDLYDFDESAPETMSVSSSTSRVRKFDLQLMSDSEMFEMMMDALKSEEGTEGLDSLLEGIGDEDSEGTGEEPALEEEGE